MTAGPYGPAAQATLDHPAAGPPHSARAQGAKWRPVGGVEDEAERSDDGGATGG